MSRYVEWGRSIGSTTDSVLGTCWGTRPRLQHQVFNGLRHVLVHRLDVTRMLFVMVDGEITRELADSIHDEAIVNILR